MTLSELADSVDILQYISQYTEFEEKNGEFWALSPLKEEDTPSFSVNTEINRFYDFSSGKSGNVLDFIKSYNHCGIRDAARILQQYVGNDSILRVNRGRMGAASIARKFAKKKQIKHPSKSVILADDYMLRYEKDMEKLALWASEGISEASMDRFQVFYDSFSNRIVYPIRNIEGKIINVSGRTIDPKWKEKKLRKYTYFYPLGCLDTVYGVAENRFSIHEEKEIILFEGAKSVMIADGWGWHNTGAILTSHLNPYQVKILASLCCRIVFALDKGVDIREDENIRKLRHFANIEYIYDSDGLLDDKMSPVDAGIEVWRTLYERRRAYE